MVRMWTTVVGLVLAVAATMAGQQADEQIRARQRIAMMEGTLERAVSIGADNLLRRMRAVVPDAPMLSGAPVVRGFRLDGYGVFFDVGVPGLRLPITWPLRYMVNENRDFELLAADFGLLASDLRAVMTQLDAQSQERFAHVVRRLETLQRPRPIGPPGAASGPSPDTVASRGGVDAALLDRPQERYTAEIKAALVEAMVESSSPLGLGADEWLTVAARDNVPRDPLLPGDNTDFSTLIFRVKGRDLAAFHTGRVALDEARQKVEVREY